MVAFYPTWIPRLENTGELKLYLYMFIGNTIQAYTMESTLFYPFTLTFVHSIRMQRFLITILTLSCLYPLDSCR